MDYREADLNRQQRLLCDFAIKLTLSPSAVDASDIQQLREVGFSEEQVTIATQVVGYFNYINRIADALDVAQEDFIRPWEKTAAESGQHS